jgi:archaellum component FlaG (FlaF/FlaG flagellin family)
MGADTTSTHLIFFIAATVVATATAGILSGVITDVVGKAQVRGHAFGNEITSEVKIINDPSKVVVSPSTIFYVKNTGATTLDYNNATVLVDGAVVTTTKALLNGETSFRSGAIMQITYAATPAAGDHRVLVTMENGVNDEMRFRV